MPDGRIARLVDDVLDRTVLPGYTRVGYRIRRRLWQTAGPSDGSPLAGRAALVTGTTSGLGEAAAIGLGRAGARVHAVARDADRGEEARRRIERAAGGAEVRLWTCDLSDLDAVRRLAADVLSAEPDLSVLVNNAGVLPPEHRTSPQGHELALATNVLAPFLLTNLLLGRLQETAPSRVVLVSSGGMYASRLDVDRLLDPPRERYDGPTAYSQTKRAEVVLAAEWAARLASSGVAVHSMHPGWADTPGVAASLPRFYRIMGPLLRSPEEGADTIVWLCTAPGASEGGAFWHDRRPRPEYRTSRTREDASERRRLWKECCRLTGWRDDDREAPGE